MEEDKVDPSVMVTHIGGLESAREATLQLSRIGGGKMLIYPHLNIPVIAIDDFEEKGRNDMLFAGLGEGEFAKNMEAFGIQKSNHYCWKKRPASVYLM